MSGQSASSGQAGRAQLSPSQLIDIYNQALPISLATLMNQVPSSTATIADAATQSNPIYTAGTLDQLNQYAGGYQRAGAELSNQQAKSQADLIRGSGRDLAISADTLAREVNPNYYKVQDASSEQAKNLINSYNLNGLSPGEANAAERSLNQSNQSIGNLGINNAVNTLSNAQQFGSAYDAKRAALANALGVANQTATSAQNTGFNPVNLALAGGNLNSNFGMGQFNPTQANATTQLPINAGTGFGTQLAGNASTSNYTGGSQSGGGGVSCCFIMTEGHHGILPVEVRICRDGYYKAFPQIANGYKRMAKYLVPLMQKSDIIHSIIYHTMVKPLTKYGMFVLRRDIRMRKYRVARTFWFNIWYVLGF